MNEKKERKEMIKLAWNYLGAAALQWHTKFKSFRFFVTKLSIRRSKNANKCFIFQLFCMINPLKHAVLNVLLPGKLKYLNIIIRGLLRFVLQLIDVINLGEYQWTLIRLVRILEHSKGRVTGG